MIFNEDKLEAEIIKTWGEFGAHNEVFQAMRKKISDKKQLTLTDVIVSSCCKGTGFIELPNGEDCYCFCEIGKKQRSQQYKL